jgi:hypothetical protein
VNERVVPKIINFCVVKLSNSPAKAGPMSTANALGLTCVPRLELDNCDSQPDSLRINQRFPGFQVTWKGTPILSKISKRISYYFVDTSCFLSF